MKRRILALWRPSLRTRFYAALGCFQGAISRGVQPNFNNENLVEVSGGES